MTDARTTLLFKEIITDALQAMFCFFTFHTISAFLSVLVPMISYGYQFEHAWNLTALSSVFIFLLIRRLKLPNSLMLFLHIFFGIVDVAVLWFIRGGGNRGTYSILIPAFLTIVNLVYSMRQRYKVKADKPTNYLLTISLAVHILMFIFLLVSNQTEYYIESTEEYIPIIKPVNTVIINAIIIIAIFCFSRQLNVFEDKYSHNAASSSQPVGPIKRQNNIFSLIVLGVIAVCTALAFILPVNEFAKLLGAGFLAFTTFIGRFVNPDELPEFQPEEKKLLLPEDEEVSLKPDLVIGKVADVAIVLLVAAAVVFFIFVLLAAFKRFNNVRNKKETFENNAVTDIIEEIEHTRTASGRRNFGHGIEHKIRKAYYNKVRKAIKAGAPVTDASAPREIEKILLERGDRSISDITDKYEDIRYR